MVPVDYTSELAQRPGYQGRTDRPGCVYLYVPLSHLIHVTRAVERHRCRPRAPRFTSPRTYTRSHSRKDRTRVYTQVRIIPGGTAMAPPWFGIGPG